MTNNASEAYKAYTSAEVLKSFIEISKDNNVNYMDSFDDYMLGVYISVLSTGICSYSKGTGLLDAIGMSFEACNNLNKGWGNEVIMEKNNDSIRDYLSS